MAGYGPAMLISIKFFRAVLKGAYPMNYYDDSYILAATISIGVWLVLRIKDIDNI